MFSHRSFLVLGGGDGADIVSLIKGGLEISDFSFSFQQGVDDRGKATTRVYAGTISITLSQLPTQQITQWSLDSRKSMAGAIIMLDSENIPAEKVFFENAICTHMEINYTQTGNTYASTKLILETEKLTVGEGLDFDNEWKY